MPCLVLSGLPGTGKTTLALAIAHGASQAGYPTFVLHSDLLKVWLRETEPALRGPGYGGDFAAKAAIANRALHRQATKADRDGYWLVVEGTLAGDFFPAGGIHGRIVLAENRRRQRLAGKPDPARSALARDDLAPYARWLAVRDDRCDLRLKGDRPVADLAAELLAVCEGRANFRRLRRPLPPR